MFLVMGKFRLHRRLFRVPGMINFRCDGRSETEDENSSYDYPPPPPLLGLYKFAVIFLYFYRPSKMLMRKCWFRISPGKVCYPLIFITAYFIIAHIFLSNQGLRIYPLIPFYIVVVATVMSYNFQLYQWWYLNTSSASEWKWWPYPQRTECLLFSFGFFYPVCSVQSWIKLHCRIRVMRVTTGCDASRSPLPLPRYGNVLAWN
jgi:hypothetical protein